MRAQQNLNSVPGLALNLVELKRTQISQLGSLTMKKSKISVREFRSVASAIYAYIEDNLGITVEHYKQQQQHKRERSLEPV